VNDAARYSPRYVRLVVALLTGAVFVEFFHRQVLAVAMDEIGRDLALSDTQLGSLVTVFAAAYAVAAPMLGRVADRMSRRSIYSTGIAVWSVATALGGLAGSFGTLLATRVVTGVGQAASGATNSPLIVDYVAPDRRGGVLALASMGATVAALAAGAFGSAGVLEAFGWRAFFAGAGVAGVLFAVAFALIVKEPPRGWSEGRGATTHAQVPAREILPELVRRLALVHTLAGTVINSIAVFAIAQWVVVFFERVHRLSNAGASAALMWVALASTLGAVAGGVLANRAWTAQPRWVLLAPALCSALACPALFLGASAREAGVAIALYSLSGLLALVHSAPAAAAMQGMIPDRMRSVATGLIASLLTLFGMGGGPFITGFLSDLFGGAANPASIGRALGWISALFLWAGAHFFLAARTFARDLASASEPVGAASAEPA